LGSSELRSKAQLTSAIASLTSQFDKSDFVSRYFGWLCKQKNLNTCAFFIEIYNDEPMVGDQNSLCPSLRRDNFWAIRAVWLFGDS
jgi:hypothetical protein